MKKFDSKRSFIPLVKNSRWCLTRSRVLEAVFIRIAMSFIFALSFSLQSPALADDGAFQGSTRISFNSDINFEGSGRALQAINANIGTMDVQKNLEDGIFDVANSQLFGMPDLIVSVSKIRTKEKRGGVELEFQIEVKNIGDGVTGERVTILAAISSKDLPPMVITGLQPGASAQFKYKRHFRRDLAGRTILLTVDSENNISEMDEYNNQTMSMIP